MIICCVCGYLISKYVFLPWSFDISLFAQIFLFCGYEMRSLGVFEKKLSFEFITLVFLVWIVGVFSNPISMNDRVYTSVITPILTGIAGAFLFINFIRCISKIDMLCTILCYFGRYSLIVLIFHVMAGSLGSWRIEFINKVLYQESTISQLSLIISRLLLSIIIIEVFARIPYLNSIYNCKK